MTDQTDKAALPGHAADSPGNDYLAPGRYRESPPGWAAVGHPTTQSHGCEVLNFQTRTMRPGVSLATVYGNEGPIASSIQQHQGQAQVQVLDQLAAANPGLAPQMGPRYPGGIAPQPPAHIAPTSATPVQERPMPPVPAMFYNHERGQIQRPWKPDGAA